MCTIRILYVYLCIQFFDVLVFYSHLKFKILKTLKTEFTLKELKRIHAVMQKEERSQEKIVKSRLKQNLPTGRTEAIELAQVIKQKCFDSFRNTI